MLLAAEAARDARPTSEVSQLVWRGARRSAAVARLIQTWRLFAMLAVEERRPKRVRSRRESWATELQAAGLAVAADSDPLHASRTCCSLARMAARHSGQRLCVIC